MREFRIAWRGHDLYDSIEEEGMTLTARASYHIACEIVSALRNAIHGYVPEPCQDDSWASLEFSNLGQRFRCTIALQDENDYAVAVDSAQGFLHSLFGGRPAPLKPENSELVRNAFACNPRFEILSDSAST